MCSLTLFPFTCHYCCYDALLRPRPLNVTQASRNLSRILPPTARERIAANTTLWTRVGRYIWAAVGGNGDILPPPPPKVEKFLVLMFDGECDSLSC